MTNMEKTFRERLAQTEAVSSLLAEQRVAEALRTRGWQVVHGFYYRDSETNKYREVDVAGQVNWTFGEKGYYDDIRVRLVAECKSGKETNIVVAPFNPPDFIEYGHASPILSVGASGDAVRDALREEIRSTLPIPDSIEAYNRLIALSSTFSMSETILASYVLPPAAEHCGAAFREISGIKEKELDASVLWRSFQSVHSAVDALRSVNEEYIRGAVREAFHEDWQEHKNIYKALCAGFASGYGMVEAYHPLIITYANLWMLRDGELESVDQFRFFQTSHAGVPFRWVDVVNTGALDTFIERTTFHYKEQVEMRAERLDYKSTSLSLFCFLTEGK